MARAESMSRGSLSPELAARIAALALGCVERRYPYHLTQVLHEASELAEPARLTPAFCGCFDWHSAVHAHWSLARITRLWPELPESEAARALLARQLTGEKLAAERAYLEPRPGFERPYGLAWLLALAAELSRGEDPEPAGWARALQPLERLAAARLVGWFEGLPAPIRSGEHAQSAFAMAMAWDWARATGELEAEERIAASARRLHGDDRDAPLHLEPSGHDFLSPALGVADLMRRVLADADYGEWLHAWLPGIPTSAQDAAAWLPVSRSPDPEDGKLAHLDGLASSRAWMLRGMAGGLPVADPRRSALLAAAEAHAAAGIAALATEHYAGTHWLGSFALHAATSQG